jgi:hypothetical protein
MEIVADPCDFKVTDTLAEDDPGLTLTAAGTEAIAGLPLVKETDTAPPNKTSSPTKGDPVESSGAAMTAIGAV